MPTFTLLYHDKPVKTYHFDEPVITIGRLPENTISIPNMSVSRRHARVELEPNGRHILIDLNSLNGTLYKNNKVTARTPLESGDTFSVGTYTIIYEDSEATDNSSHSASPVEATDSESMGELKSAQRPTTAVTKETTPVLIETSRHLVYKLTGDYVTLGNSEKDQVFVEGSFITESHVILERRSDGWWISTRKMLGKFRVNGKKVKTHHLRHKDRVELGLSTFRFMEHG